MNHIDIKVTVWNRMKFADKADMKEVLETLKDKGVDYAIDDALAFLESETLYDSEEQIDPSGNEGASTIEVYQNGQLIWQNGSESGG